MKNSGGNKGSKGSSPRSGGQKDRKSCSGMIGSPKKGGHGGKFTWAGDGYSTAELGFDKKAAIDVKDPNFEDGDQISVNEGLIRFGCGFE